MIAGQQHFGLICAPQAELPAELAVGRILDAGTAALGATRVAGSRRRRAVAIARSAVRQLDATLACVSTHENWTQQALGLARLLGGLSLGWYHRV